MPELPEVETVMRGMRPHLEGARLMLVEKRRADLRFAMPATLEADLTGARIKRLRRRAKYILADLEAADGRALVLLLHLGMSGRIMISGNNSAFAPGPHDHVRLETESGARIVFRDPRRFGMLFVFSHAEEADHKLLKPLGPEPLSPDFDAAAFAAALKTRRSPIKASLLDQRLVAGLGNIYVCEALYRAGISPTRRGDRIAFARLLGLYPPIRAVLEEAIETGGSSLRDYRHIDDGLGYFQHRFDVYDRAGAPCRRPGCGGQVRRIVQSGRSSFYCPACQR